MSDTTTPSGYTLVTTDDGATVVSSETVEQITESLKPEAEPVPEPEPAKETDPKLAKAASKLGKAGGEAAAAKRAEAKAQEAEAAGEKEPDEAAKAKADLDEELSKETDPERRKKLASDRVEAATRKNAATKRELERERTERARERTERDAEIDRLRKAAPAPAKTEPTKPDVDPNAKPVLDNFATYDEWVEALADWKADQKLRTFQQELVTHARTSAQRADREKAITTFTDRMAKAASADSTYKDRTRGLMTDERFKPSFTLQRDDQGRMVGYGPLNVAADEVFRSEHAPALTLYFAEHPEELQRLETLPTVGDVQVEVRLLARSLEVATLGTSTPKQEVSQAHPPTRPVVGAPHIADQVPGEDASYEDHKRYWNSRDRAQARR